MSEMTATTMDGLNAHGWPTLPTEYVEPRWYAAYTCARHEKRVAEQLKWRAVEMFLPLYETVHRWKNGRARVELPLFPSYVFVRIALKDRLQVLELPSVVRLVGFDGHPAVLPDREIEALRTSVTTHLRTKPHPYLTVGRRVRIKCGPLAGLEGILIRKKNVLRVVLSLDLIMSSVSVEVDGVDVELAPNMQS